jgi:uncharacterized protein (DUF2147 family)
MNASRLPLLIAAFAFAAGVAQAASVEGDWLTPKGGGKVHIAPCGPKLCGTITWLKRSTDKAGQPLKDTLNPDPALKARPVVGVRILSGMKPAGDGRWTGGSIYNPGDGKTYDSKMTLDPTGVLKVQGCVTIVCITQIWTRPS